jgi:hypothetical protein
MSLRHIALPPKPLNLLKILKHIFLNLPLWDIFRGVARRGDGVEDEAELAALGPGGDPVEADVELGAVGWVGVLRVGVGDVELVGGKVQKLFLWFDVGAPTKRRHDAHDNDTRRRKRYLINSP